MTAKTKPRDGQREREKTVMLTFTPEMIEEVWKEYEQENPGRSYEDMGSKEFADRCMKKLYASAEYLKAGNA